jgi:hypothetical protein
MTHSEPGQGGMDAAYKAQERAPVLRAIEAMPGGQAEAFGLAEAMYPPPSKVDYRTRETRDWNNRQMAVIRVWAELVEAGLVTVIRPADGVNPDLTEVSQAGRDWLAQHHAPAGSGHLS